MNSNYIYANIFCVILLFFSLCFSVISVLPVIDPRKTVRRQSLALFFLYASLGIKIVLWLYWYFLMQGISLNLSGERCILGVLSKVGDISWLMGVLKIFSFPVLLYCLSLRHIDADMKSKPFRGIRVRWILFTAPFLIFESFVDIIVQKRVADLIIGSTHKIFALHVGVSWGRLESWPYFWTVLYVLSCVSLFVILLLLLKYSSEDLYLFSIKKLMILQSAVASISLCVVVSFFLAMHNEFCPLLLDMENHFCGFCLLQYSFGLPVSLLLVLLGFGFSFSLGFVPHLRQGEVNVIMETRRKSIFVDKYQGIVKAAFITMIAGLIIVFIHLAVALIW